MIYKTELFIVGVEILPTFSYIEIHLSFQRKLVVNIQYRYEIPTVVITEADRLLAKSSACSVMVVKKLIKAGKLQYSARIDSRDGT